MIVQFLQVYFDYKRLLCGRGKFSRDTYRYGLDCREIGVRFQAAARDLKFQESRVVPRLQ